MREGIRRIKLIFLLVEMVAMFGIPAPRRWNTFIQRVRTRRWERQRTRRLPRTMRGYESLMHLNPELAEPWKRSTHIRQKSNFSM